MLKHLKELMVDASMYGWEPLQAYNGLWLKQLENGRAEWQDADLKLAYRRALVWNSIQTGLPTPHMSAAPQQNENKETLSKPVPSTPPPQVPKLVFCSIKGNVGLDPAAHPSERHICTYCLDMVNHVCLHKERFCRCKVYDQAARD